MTERLKDLLHDEATGIQIPAPALAETLTTARGMVRRRRIRAGLATAAVFAIVGGGVAVANLADSPERQQIAEPRSAAEAYLAGGAYATGDKVHFGEDGKHTVDVGQPVKSLYYTSAGVVVRSGESAFTDSAGPSAYALVTPDGRIEPLSAELGDVAPDTDPAAPHLAWVEPADAGWEVVVLDVSTDEEVARVPFRGAYEWAGWAAPPVALVGDQAYVALDRATVAVDWRTGEVSDATALEGSRFPDVAGNVGIREDRNQIRVMDLATGEDVLSVFQDEQTFPWVALSPDGRFALVQSDNMRIVDAEVQTGTVEAPDAEARKDGVRLGKIKMGELRADSYVTQGETTGTWTIHDLSTGASAEVEAGGSQFGWTPDGHLLRVQGNAISVCDPVPFACGKPAPIAGKGALRLGGSNYES